jgi:hypothetical protein
MKATLGRVLSEYYESSRPSPIEAKIHLRDLTRALLFAQSTNPYLLTDQEVASLREVLSSIDRWLLAGGEV